MTIAFIEMIIFIFYSSSGCFMVFGPSGRKLEADSVLQGFDQVSQI